YALSGFESVNPYNGNLNFRLPLLRVGGRGSAGYAITLTLNTKRWSVRHSQTQTSETWTPTQNSWGDNNPGYGPGRMLGRKSGFDPLFTAGCPNLPSNKQFFKYTLTTLTFTAADGTEYDFRDRQSGGVRIDVGHCPPPFPYRGASRGRVWVTADGSAATFISDDDIYDQVDVPAGTRTFAPSGYMLLRDGTRYRIDSGGVTWIRDRNGNQVSPNVDSLGRVVTIDYDVSDPAYGLCDRIHYSGFGGEARTIYVTKTALENALRAGYGPQSYSQLFPDLNVSSLGTGAYSTTVVSGVVLPDGRGYQFRYNSYGELARVVLPTGGAIEYDMAPGSGVVVGNNNEGDAKEIYRRVAERRTYPDGSTLEGRTVYEDVSDQSGTYVEVRNYSGSTVVGGERHYFAGGSAREHVIQPLDGLGSPVQTYPAWDEGRETAVEQYATDGTSLTSPLRATATTWQPNGTMGGLPVNPVAVATTTTLKDVTPNLVAKTTAVDPQTGALGFDQYNNPTDVWEYDFGSGGPGAFARRTHTDYVTTAAYVNADVNPSAGASLRNLPYQQWASSDEAGANKMSLTVYAYDQ
ncbi:MAG TPA: hypothetical protein VNZ44_16080, partial [Pyrinomonadaceae bacterium]|nr:hypothetical protein [Pyrinomonadaceae bacterium]